MEVYRWEGTGFRQLRALRFGEERDLEDLLERDPAFLLENERLLVISRQAPIGHRQKVDLLAVDTTGNCVIIELKRGKPHRSSIAQLLEYAASVSKLTYADLESLAQRWFQQRGKAFASLSALHSDFFNYEPGGLKEAAFNRKQRLVLVSEGVDTRVLELAEYLRRIGVDLTYISYFSYQAPNEILLATKTMLGATVIEESRRPYQHRTKQPLTRGRFLAILHKNETLYEVATRFFEYVENCGAILRPRIALMRMTIGGRWWLGAYPSKRATHFRVNVHGDFTSSEVAACREHVPDVTPKPYGMSFNIETQAHLQYALEVFERVRNAILED